MWADVETTGLHKDDVLLEIAVVVTDSDLRVLGDPVSIVLSATDKDLAAMVEPVTTMHRSSGLTEACRQSSVTLRQAQDQILEYVCAWVPLGVAPLCGSSIAFDRHFISRDLPVFDAFLHYRTVDVSTVKELARRWFPPQYSQLPQANKAHRALLDIYDSIRELEFYRSNVFR